ncbi:MAG: hypothetical protein D6761_01370 [Candidatus Dadabacteria bacterium]|nr:MAG: hypothetical protein D6761_01370 [Candidatus Dadabacteria bacterium]
MVRLEAMTMRIASVVFAVAAVLHLAASASARSASKLAEAYARIAVSSQVYARDGNLLVLLHPRLCRDLAPRDQIFGFMPEERVVTFSAVTISRETTERFTGVPICEIVYRADGYSLPDELPRFALASTSTWQGRAQVASIEVLSPTNALKLLDKIRLPSRYGFTFDDVTKRACNDKPAVHSIEYTIGATKFIALESSCTHWTGDGRAGKSFRILMKTAANMTVEICRQESCPGDFTPDFGADVDSDGNPELSVYIDNGLSGEASIVEIAPRAAPEVVKQLYTASEGEELYWNTDGLLAVISNP